MHHFSSFNNQWYRKSIEYMQDIVGTQPSKWCAGCHDHAVFFNGRFDRPIKEQIDTPKRRRAWRARRATRSRTSAARWARGTSRSSTRRCHDLAASKNPVLQYAHDKLTFLDPEPHKQTFLKPFHRDQTPDFCSVVPQGPSRRAGEQLPVVPRLQRLRTTGRPRACRARARAPSTYPPEVEHVRRLPHAEGAVERSGRQERRRPLAPLRGANTALPFVNGDKEQLKLVQQFLQDGPGSPWISSASCGAARRAGDAPGDPERRCPREHVRRRRRVAELRRAQAFIATPSTCRAARQGGRQRHAGESVRLEVVVRTRKVGHFFPGGTVDAFDVWVELEAVDDRARTILHSGRHENGGKGPVEPGAHFYRSLLLDEHGNQINKRNACGRSRRSCTRPDSARRGGHGALPARRPEGRAGRSRCARR
jgi:hypothetical protein